MINLERSRRIARLSETLFVLRAALALVGVMGGAGNLLAHQITFNSSMTYSNAQPSGGAASVANWTGATFDADNVGGSGVNANGSPNNGTANDGTTYVANNQPVQGQSFLTGGAANGYQLNAVAVRMAGYNNNVASGGNGTAWNVHEQNGPIILTICEINGTDRTVITMQNFKAGDAGNPGNGSSANGPGTYITFRLPFTTFLKPHTTYGFELAIGNGGANFFEWLGVRTNALAGGTAYTRQWWGGPLTPFAGDRVFLADMTALASAPTNFAHPGTLHTQADLNRMKAKVAANQQPWLSGYNVLLSSPYNNPGWPAYDVDYIVRGAAGNNYTRSQQDAQLIYTLTMIWHMTGNNAYADRAVQIANVWSDLLGLQGDSNVSLAAGICGYLFAIAGDLLSTYPGWAAADKQAYKEMMMRVFYPANFDFLWRHHDTFWREGGNTHYRLNWDTANMASMAAIGILCDSRAVYEQALDFFKYGPGNGRVERAAWYIHPRGLGQGEEAGRDQGHNLGGWYAMALLCQMAWNQGDDLFGYDNNRVLRVFEYNAKYNLGEDVPYARHQNTDLGYTEGTVSAVTRGIGQYFQHELVYNHYAKAKGIAAPWSKLAAQATRPEPWPNTGIHPSQVDWFGLGTLTFQRDALTTDQAPTGLRANWSKDRVRLDWWGSARATNYLVKHASSIGGPYVILGAVAEPDLNFTATNVVNGTTNFYVITASTPSGNLDSAPLRVVQELVTHYTFEATANDIVGPRHAQLKGGSTGLPGYATGFGGGQAIELDGADDYVQMPVGTANYHDITIASWVRWDGGNAWQRIFDFGSEVEKTMFLTARNGEGVIEFGFTTTKGGNFLGDASYSLTGPAMTVGAWMHVAVTLNGDIATLYVNGVPRNTQVVDLIDPLFGQPFCYLGKSMYNSDPLFNGRIDDFRIYNYALPGADVYSLWGQSANQPPRFAGHPITKPAALEDTPYSGSLAADASDPNGGTLTFSKLDGSSWLNVAANGSLSGTPGNGNVGENLFVVRVTDASGATDDANLYITVINTNDRPTWLENPITRPEVTRGVPYAGTIAGTATDVDAGDSFAYSKVSGPAWLNVSASGTLTGTPSAGDAGLNIFTVRATDSFGGTNDASLRIEVLPYSLRSHYEFEGNASDSLGNNPAAASGSPAYAPGRFGQAIQLDGVDDYVTLSNTFAALVFREITVAAWVNWNGGSQWQRIFDFGDDTTEYMFLSPRSGENTLRFAIADGGGEQQLNTTQLASGQWMHVAVTLGGGIGTLYVNGVPRATNSATTLNPSDFTPAVNYIGKSQFPDSLFAGRIDDFRIYNYALSAVELMNLVAPGGAVVSPALVPSGATWRYFDKTNDLGTSWRSSAFNDTGWSNGRARLGYGGDGEATKVASNRQWTTYFRRPFYVSNPTNVLSLNARLTRDDAAVIFLNGTEVWRDTNFANGTITNQTPALGAITGTEETNWLTTSLSPSNLITGWNLIAAEVHNQSLTSTDLGFDFELTGIVAVTPPALGIAYSPGALTLSAPADASYFACFSATNLTPPVTWTAVTNTPALTNGLWTLQIPLSGETARFFRLEER